MFRSSMKSDRCRTAGRSPAEARRVDPLVARRAPAFAARAATTLATVVVARTAAAAAVAALALVLAGGCSWDSMAPEAPPPATTGMLEVTSSPAGAAIFVNGEDTGRVTPATFDAWPIGGHAVRVSLSGFVAAPESALVTVSVGALASATFALEAAPEPVSRIVLIEHYTNANCPPCRPVEEILATVLEEQGFDKVISIGNHMFWPGTDPFFDANPVELEARRAAFGVQAMPEFWIDGRRFGTPQDYGLLTARIEEGLAVEPEFDITVEGAVVADSFVVTGTLDALEPTDGDEVLMVVIIETSIAYRALDGVDLVFDDVTRRFASGPGGEPMPADHQGERPFRYAVPIGAGWNTNNLEAVAFVQSSDTRIVYQAASTRQ
jgi:hypothetical protein